MYWYIPVPLSLYKILEQKVALKDHEHKILGVMVSYLTQGGEEPWRGKMEKRKTRTMRRSRTRRKRIIIRGSEMREDSTSYGRSMKKPHFIAGNLQYIKYYVLISWIRKGKQLQSTKHNHLNNHRRHSNYRCSIRPSVWRLISYGRARMSLLELRSNRHIVHHSDDRWMNMEQWLNGNDGKKPKSSEKALPSATLSRHIIPHRLPREQRKASTLRSQQRECAYNDS